MLDDDLVEEMTESFSYDVSLGTFDFDSLVSTNSVIGTDTRYKTSPTSSPYCAVAYLSCGGKRGTAFLVSEHVMITAAHCVVDTETKTVRGNSYVYFGVHGTTRSYDSYAMASSVSYPTAYYDDEENSYMYDWAILEFEEPISCDYYFNCVIGSNSTISQEVYVSGYPSDCYYYQMTSLGIPTYTDTYIIKYTNDTAVGMSGSPVYYKNLNCIGIHTRSYSTETDGTTVYTSNGGNLFTSSLYSLICNRISRYE